MRTTALMCIASRAAHFACLAGLTLAGQAKAQIWLQLSPIGTPPDARADATSVYNPTSNSMVLFGGNNGPCGTSGVVTLNDTWLLSDISQPPRFCCRLEQVRVNHRIRPWRQVANSTINLSENLQQIFQTWDRRRLPTHPPKKEGEGVASGRKQK